MNGQRRLSAFCLLLFAALCVWTCDISDKPGDNLLTLNLSDSLARYDSILITVKNGDGLVQRDSLLRKPYGPVENHKFQAVLNMGGNAPETYAIFITVYGGGKPMEYRIEVTPDAVKPPVRIDTVKTDAPVDTVKTSALVMSVGRADTTVSVGSSVTLLPVVGPQGYGSVAKFKWDLDGVSGWDDSADAIKSVTVKCDQEQEYRLRFYVRDSKGNETLAFKTISAVLGPRKPDVKVNAASPSNVKRPVWTWSGGGGGNGLFQYKFDGNDFASGASTPARATEFTPAADLGDGVHTLYVRESDSLGGWSAPGSASITIDTTAPGAPKVLGASPTSVSPKWTWSSGGGGSGDYRFKVDANPSASDPETRLLEYTLASAVSKTTYILYLQERDAAGNWSPVSNLPIFYDLSKPTVAFTAPQVSGTFLTRNGSVDLAGTSTSPQGAGMVKSVEYFVDGTRGSLSTNLAGDGSWSIKALPLTNNKTVAVKVVATDGAGNQGEATLNVRMDNTAPGAPAFTAQPPAIVKKSDTVTTLRWVWSRTGEATDSFVVKLNGTEVSRQTGTAYAMTLLSDGTYQLEVSEMDGTGNASAFTGSGSVRVDRTPPNAPDLSQPPTPRRTVQWTWTSGGGGNGSYQCQLDGGTVFACTTPYSPSNPTDGDHILNVRELDAAGNTSAYSSTRVTIDVQKPVISLTSHLTAPTQVFSSISAFEGKATDDRQMRYVRVKVGADTILATGSNPFSVTPNLPSETQVLTFIAEDVAGNQSTTQITVTYEPTVIFVRKGATGLGDGSSWANAFPELSLVLRADKNYPAGKQAWVTEGTYIPSDREGFKVHSDFSMYGGFASDGTDRSLSARDLTHHVTILNQHPDGAYVISNLSDKGSEPGAYAQNITLANFKVDAGKFPVTFSSVRKGILKGFTLQYGTPMIGVFISNSTIDISDSFIFQNQTGEGGIEINGENSRIRIRNTTVSSNTTGDGGGITFYDGRGTLCLGSGSRITNNSDAEVVAFGANGASFSRESTVTIGDGGLSGVSDLVVGSCPDPF